ncbi:hypothetical protein Scep_023172 [Stephania cephalantha]|uniref:Uncharacterized protein n=1 Tax=Stephania cephalantha TaxID=152367 RepID=A0AAP0EX29_9MAGN
MLQTQPIVELINQAGINIKTESLASFLAFLCEQGSIEEAVSVLDEVRSVYFPAPRRSYGSVEMGKLEREEALRRVTAKSTIPQCASNLDHRLEDLNNAPKTDLHYTSRNSLLREFDAFYSLVASLCSSGEVEKASQVAKEMLLSTGKGAGAAVGGANPVHTSQVKQRKLADFILQWWWQSVNIVCAGRDAVTRFEQPLATYTDNSILAASETGSAQLKIAAILGTFEVKCFARQGSRHNFDSVTLMNIKLSLQTIKA